MPWSRKLGMRRSRLVVDGHVLVLTCRVVPKALKTYRHFEAEIAVCRRTACLSLDELPEEIIKNLHITGGVVITSMPEWGFKTLPSFKEGSEYLRLVLSESC